LLSVTTVVENVFCPRFTYFGEVLGLDQYEQKRGCVANGRQYHHTSERQNKNYVPSSLNGKKITSLKLYSKKYDLVGIVDHAIETGDCIIIIERKYSDFGKIYDTLKVQLGLLSILLEENLSKPVKFAYVIFGKDGKHIQIKIEITEDLCKFALDMMRKTKQIISSGIIPESKYDNRCNDCCFRKICEYGSLNTP